MNITAMLALIVSSTLVYSAPLIFTASGGAYSEHSGIVNVGLEGTMTIGAFSSIIFNSIFASTFKSTTPWLGVIMAGICGLIFSLLHAVATVNWYADHIIPGTVLNLMAPSLGVFLIKTVYDKGQTENISANFGYYNVSVLSNIPVIGDIFFKNTSAPAWVAIILSTVLWWVLYKIPFGLRLRSVGENPQAADTMGVNVCKMRYVGVLISGLLGGIGGGVFAQAISGNFNVLIIVRQGFMALAATIFGKWDPIRAMLSSLFFGSAQSLSIIGSQLPFISHAPSVYLQIAPYVITVVVLVAFFGKGVVLAADGQIYVKSK